MTQSNKLVPRLTGEGGGWALGGHIRELAAAIDGGADWNELCAALASGGLTTTPN